MRSFLVPLAAVLLLSACARTQPAPSGEEPQAAPAEGAVEAAPEAPGEAVEPPGEAVELTFDWSGGLTLPVSLDVERVREGGRGRQIERARLAYVLDAAPTEEGLLVTSRDVEVLEAVGAESELTALMAQIPTLVVSDAGEVLAVRDASSTVDAALAAAGVPAHLMEELRPQLTDTLEAGAADWWDGLVGLWAGETLELGRTYERVVEEALPVLGVPVEVRLAYQAEERVPCEEDGEDAACIALRIVSEPEEDAVAGALAAWAEKTAGLPPEAAPKILDVTSRAEILLVTEPEGLRPHHLERTREIDVVFEDPAGGAQTQKGINRSVYRFE